LFDSLAEESFEEILSRCLTPAFLDRASRDLAVSRLTAALPHHAGAANPIGSFFFWNALRRDIALAPYAILSDVGCVYSPYLDHDVYDLLASLPAGLLLDKRFHDDAIRRAYPRYATLPYEQDAPEQKNVLRHLHFPLELIGFGLAHGRSAMVQRRSLGRRITRPLRILALYLMQLEQVIRRGEPAARFDMPIQKSPRIGRGRAFPAAQRRVHP
jgi:hypothetical protein